MVLILVDTYGIRLSYVIPMEYDYHIFLKYLTFQTENLVFQIKKPSISIGNLGFRSKNEVFLNQKFEILSFSHIDFEMLQSCS